MEALLAPWMEKKLSALGHAEMRWDKMTSQALRDRGVGEDAVPLMVAAISLSAALCLAIVISVACWCIAERRRARYERAKTLTTRSVAMNMLEHAFGSFAQR